MLVVSLSGTWLLAPWLMIVVVPDGIPPFLVLIHLSFLLRLLLGIINAMKLSGPLIVMSSKASSVMCIIWLVLIALAIAYIASFQRHTYCLSYISTLFASLMICFFGKG